MTVAPEAPARAPEADDGAAGGGRVRAPGAIACLVGLALVAGSVLRFVTVSDLWLDEALTVNVAELPLANLEEALRHDGAPPLFYVLLHGWMRVFGDGDVAVRSLSGLFGLASLPVAWFVGRRMGGRFTAWAGVLLLASSPFAIRYATEARMYALQMFLVLVGYLALARAIERPSLPRLALVAGITGALLYTQYWSIYMLAAVGVGVLWWGARAPEAHERQASRSAAVAMAAGVLTFLPWVPTFLYQAENTGTPWGEAVFPATGLAGAVLEFGGGNHPEGIVLMTMLLLVFALAVFGRALDRHRIEIDVRTRPGVRIEAAVVGVTLLIGLTASYAAGTAFQGRYAALVMPLYALVVAYGLLAFADVRVRAGVLAALVLVGFVGGVRNATTRRTQAHQVAAVIRSEARATDVVAYCPDQVGPDVSRLLDGETGLEHLTFPDGGPPEFVDWVDYQRRVDRADPARFAELVLERAGPSNAVWFVTAPGYRNFEGECEAISTAMSAQRAGARPRVEPNDEFFEFQGLIEFPAAP